jgi:hypothetical protein
MEWAMNENAFRNFLKRKGKAPETVDRIVSNVQAYARYLQDHRQGRHLDQAKVSDLEAYVTWLDQDMKQSATTALWSIFPYYQFTKNQELELKASVLRQIRIAKTRKPYMLAKFMGVNPEHISKLAEHKIRNVKQMLKEGSTPQQRSALAASTGIPLEDIEDLVRLADLARIFGVKGIRARLYVDMGIHSIPMMAEWNPEELRLKAMEFVEKTGFEGIAPLPKEAAHSVTTAKSLPKLVEW